MSNDIRDERKDVFMIASHKKGDYRGLDGFLTHEYVVRFVWMDKKEQVMNFSDSSWDVENQGVLLSDLQVTGWYTENTPDEIRGHRVEYHHLIGIELDLAEMIVKVLRKVNRSMEKQKNNWGYPPNFANFVQRVAKCLNVQGVLVRTNKHIGLGINGEYRHESVANMDWAIKAARRVHFPDTE